MQIHGNKYELCILDEICQFLKALNLMLANYLLNAKSCFLQSKVALASEALFI